MQAITLASPRAAKWFLTPFLFIELHVTAIWESDIY
jgi:hypothetical protein